MASERKTGRNYYYKYKLKGKAVINAINVPAIPALNFNTVKENLIIPYLNSKGINGYTGLTYERGLNAKGITPVPAHLIAPTINLNGVIYSTITGSVIAANKNASRYINHSYSYQEAQVFSTVPESLSSTTAISQETGKFSSLNDKSGMVKEDFSSWLLENQNYNYAKNSLNVYLSYIDKVSSFLIQKNISDVDLWEIKDPNAFRNLYQIAINDNLFRATNSESLTTFIQVKIVFIKFLESKSSSKEEDLQSLDTPSYSHEQFTIREAIIYVLQLSQRGMTIEEIYNKIVENNLYTFEARKPLDVIRVEIDRACENTKYSIRAQKDYFRFISNERGVRIYYLLDSLYQSDIVNSYKTITESDFELRGVQQIMREADRTEANEKTILKPKYTSNVENGADLTLINKTDKSEYEPTSLKEERNQSKEIKIWDKSIKENFQTWMSSEKYPPGTALDYCSVIYRIIQKYKSLENSAISKSANSLEAIQNFLVLLNQDSRFIASEKITDYEYSTAFNKLCSFFEANNYIEQTSDNTIFSFCGVDTRDIEIEFPNNFRAPQICETYISNPKSLSKEEINILDVFKETFPYSMNLGFVDLCKLKSNYCTKYNASILLEDDAISNLIRSYAIKIDNTTERYTHIDNLASPEVRAEIKQFILDEIGNGIKRVYVKPIFDMFKGELGIVVNEDLLLNVIEKIFGNEFTVNKQSMFISSKKDVPTQTIDEEIAVSITNLLQENIMPFSIDEIANRLQAYPLSKITRVLFNNLESVIAVGDNQYAHIDYVYISDQQIKRIQTLIEEGIEVNGYKNVEGLYLEITMNMPDVIDMNPEIKKADMIKAIKKKVSGTYTVLRSRFVPKKGLQ